MPAYADRLQSSDTDFEAALSAQDLDGNDPQQEPIRVIDLDHDTLINASAPRRLGPGQLLAVLGVVITVAGLFTSKPPRPAPVSALPTHIQPFAAPISLDSAGAAFSSLLSGARTGWHMPMTLHARPLAEAPERPKLVFDWTTKESDRLSALLRRAGAAAEDIKAALATITHHRGDTDLYSDTSLHLVMGTRPNKQVARPIDELSYRARLDQKVALRRSNGGYIVTTQNIPVRDVPMRLHIPVGRSLYVSARKADVPARVIAALSSAMSYSVDFERDVLSKDSLDLVFDREVSGDGLEETGELQYAVLHLAKRNQPIELVRFVDNGRAEFFYPDGVSVKALLMKTPIDGARLTSSFGMRWHPILGYSRMHQGVDFGASTGTPVMAAGNGVVSYTGWHGGHGNTVILTHQNGLQTLYGHLSAFARGMRPGMRVAQGQVIAAVGSTGLSTGPHLHYEVHISGKPVNPQDKRLPTGRRLTGPALAAFKSQLALARNVKPDEPVQLAQSHNNAGGGALGGAF